MLERLFWSVTLPLLPNASFQPSWSHLKRGLWAERAVARRLWLDGYSIRAHRWLGAKRTDIDLIVANDTHIVFVEVKLRVSIDDAWADLLDEKRIDRLARCAGDYLRQTQQTKVSIRFDGWLVTAPPANARIAPMECYADYLNPAAVPGWKGLLPERATSNPDVSAR